ncbi:MAG: MFS transporter [Lachnospiraceae bacterium]|nr:MFS transporter [Lachnospiraceae bacterium]
MEQNRKKVPLLNKVAYGIGTGGGNIFSQIAAAFLLQYYTDTALISAGSIATMFLVCRVFDGISDLIMGGVVDKTKSKWGKARPWLILSGPLSLLGIVLLMHVPMGASEGAKLVYAYATYIFMAVIVYTIYGIANTALLPLMSRDSEETTMLATFSAIGNNLIGLIAGASITPLVMNLGWSKASIILGAVSCIMILFSGLLNKEMADEGDMKREAVPMKEQLPAVLKNKYFFLLLLIGVFSLLMNANAIGAQIYYCNLVLGNPAFMSVLMTAGQLPGLIILFAMPYISKRWSKQMFLLIGAVLLIAGFVITGLAGTNTTMIVIGTVIRSLGAGPLLSAVFALVPDVVEYGYWKFGIRSEGLISSAQSIGSKVGIGIGSALTGWILAGVGYNPTVAATEEVINAVRFDYTWLGAILSVAILVIVLLLNVEKYAPEYMKNNERKH